MKDSLDRILTSVPLNSTAARVVSQGGTHFTPQMAAMPHHVRQFEPLPIRRPVQSEINNPNFTDLTGRRFGRFVVLGISPNTNPKKKTKWVVRCACGAYEHRSTKTVTADVLVGSAGLCRECDYLEQIKLRYQKLGSKSVAEFTPPKA